MAFFSKNIFQKSFFKIIFQSFRDILGTFPKFPQKFLEFFRGWRSLRPNKTFSRLVFLSMNEM